MAKKKSENKKSKKNSSSKKKISTKKVSKTTKKTKKSSDKELDSAIFPDQTPEQLLKSISFCVFDLETTGGNHQNDKIIEIGLVKIKNLEITETKNFLINPEIKIPEFIQKLTNIAQKDVEKAPRIHEVMEEILEFMGDSVLVAHNTSFDVPFFNSVLRRHGKEEMPNRSLCTNLMTKYLIPNLLNTNLNYMSKIFDIHHIKAHRALDDAYATATLLITYLKIFIDKKIQKINHLYYPRNKFELDRIHFKKKGEDSHTNEEVFDQLKKVKTSFLITVKGDQGTILYSLPSSNSETEKKFIIEKISSLDWNVITIKLFGHYFEALIYFANLFGRFDNNLRGEIIRFLWKEKLPQKKMPAYKDELAESIRPLDFRQNDFGDFALVPHLVPEQFVIFPLAGLQAKGGLIFRYPGHKKKLIQFVRSKTAKIVNNKIKKVHYHPQLKEFLIHFLETSKTEDSTLFFFKKGLFQKSQEGFIEHLEEFIEKNPPVYNFPKEYI